MCDPNDTSRPSYHVYMNDREVCWLLNTLSVAYKRDTTENWQYHFFNQLAELGEELGVTYNTTIDKWECSGR